MGFLGERIAVLAGAIVDCGGKGFVLIESRAGVIQRSWVGFCVSPNAIVVWFFFELIEPLLIAARDEECGFP